MLHHRGPDDSGFETFILQSAHEFSTQSLTLGHTRLSIIDLSSGGHQPMHSGDGRFTIIFNGEIYNYRELRQELRALGFSFLTDSDTEVLLASWAQWGFDGLRRLIGMFAFAVYDRRDQSLTLVRDAFGIKPLFYSLAASSFSFASEMSALYCLLGCKPELNYQSVYNYLEFGTYDNNSDTFGEGVSHLLPGHWLRLDLRNCRVAELRRWWQPLINERTDLGFDEAAAQLREMFLENVRLHLRSDVPLGAALSGGLDSSAVVCAIRHLEPQLPIHTFTFVAPGSSVNEEPWADLVNSYVGAIPHKVHVGPIELAADLDVLIRAQGEPFGSTSIFAQYRVFQAARELGITVTLDGQGADELLAGYEGYPQARLRSLLNQHRYGAAFRFLEGWLHYPGRGRRRALQAFGLAVAPDQARLCLKQLRASLQASCLNIRWFQERGVIPVSPVDPPFPSSADHHGRQLSNALRCAMSGSGLAGLLRHADRNSMHWSLESRVPFLTTDLAEFMLSLPENYLLSDTGETKHLFRAAMRGIVPDQILDRRDKIGFATPELAWLQALSPQIDSYLAAARDIPFLNHANVTALVQATLSGKKTFSWRTWRLINFCRWMQIFQPVINA